MTVLAYEPTARTQWRKFYRNRRIAGHFGPRRDGGALLALALLASLALWVVAGYGLSLIL